MKKVIFILMTFVSLTFVSCGPSADEKARLQKAHDDSLVAAAVKAQDKEKDSGISNKISELQVKLAKAQDELTALNNDPDYLYIKTRLSTVRARVSTGGSYGWIDKAGKFWSGKDASKAFDDAAANEKNQLAKIDSKNTEIKSMQDKIKDLQGMLSNK